MILLNRDLKDTSALCAMCEAKKPEIVQYNVAEHGADLLLCCDCAMKLVGHLHKDIYEVFKHKVEKSLQEHDREADLKARMKDLTGYD